MTITPELEFNVVEELRSDPIEGPQRAVTMLLVYELADDNRIVPYNEHQITQMVSQRWDELLARALDMARRLEATAA